MQGSHGIYKPVEDYMVCCEMHWPASGQIQFVQEYTKSVLHQVQSHELQGCFVFLLTWLDELNCFPNVNTDVTRETGRPPHSTVKNLN